MFRRTITFAAVVGLVFALAPAARADTTIDIDDPLVPAGLGGGDYFQLAFISSHALIDDDAPFKIYARTEGDINVYNNWLQQLADDGASSLVKGRGITWYVIASTTGKNARDNAVLGASTPLYDVLGGKIADNFADLWDGGIDKPIDVKEDGGSNDQEILTGSNTDGNGAGGLQLGTGDSIQRGDASFFDSHWIVHDTNGDENSKIYAMSEPLKIALELVWDADTGAGDAQDGNGTWINAGDNWWDGDGGGNFAWDNTKQAVTTFGAGNATADPTVTVETVTAGLIVFSGAGGHKYTLTGGTITLEADTPTIEANVDARIESVIDAGTAVFTKTGPGTLELTGANTYSGVAVDGGTLVGYTGVGDTGSILGDVALSGGTNVTFNQESDGAYDGIITGDGSFTKTGTGTLEVTSQDHDYTGGTTVSAGTLRVTGYLPADSTVTVEDGGTLGGAGDSRVAAIDLLRGGTLAPDADVEPFYADGAVTLGAGAVYEWEVDDLDGTTVDWALLQITGFDLIVSAAPGDPFSIKVISGPASGTLEEGDSFEIIRLETDIGGTIVDFDADAFTIDTTAFLNGMGGLEFVVAERTGSLYLDVVPEPATLALLGAGLSALIVRKRRT